MFSKDVEEPTETAKFLAGAPIKKQQSLSYLDYIKNGKPVPKPMSPIKIDHEPNDNLDECQWHYHDNTWYPEELLTWGVPTVENTNSG